MWGQYFVVLPSNVIGVCVGGKFFIGIFRKNASKYIKPAVEPYVYYNFNQNYRFSSFLNNNEKKFNVVKKVIENCLQANKLISFEHL